MLNRFHTWLHQRKVKRLAHKAVKVAIAAYRSGEFQWVRYDMFAHINGVQQSLDIGRIAEANGGCALGSLSRAAWIVAGRPKYDSPGWKLREEIEFMLHNAADSVTYAKQGTSVVSFNDARAKSGEDVIRNIFEPVLEAEFPA